MSLNSGKLTKDVPDLARSSCRRSLSLPQPKACVGCEGKHDNLCTKAVNTNVPSPTASNDDTASVHSSHSISSSSMSASSVTTLLREESEEAKDMFYNSPKDPFNLLNSSSSLKRSSVLADGKDKEDQDSSEISLSKCAFVTLRNNTSNILENMTHKRDMLAPETDSAFTTTNLMKIMLCCTFISVVLIGLLAAAHRAKITSARSEEQQGDCVVLNLFRMMYNSLLISFKEMHIYPLKKIIQTVNHTIWDQSICLLNNSSNAVTATLKAIKFLPFNNAYLCMYFVLAVVTVYAVLRVFRPKQSTATGDVYGFIQKIVEILVHHHKTLRPPTNSYLSVNHVRDLLIAPHDRKRQKEVWDAAVRIIEKESRGCIVMKTSSEGTKFWRYSPSVSQFPTSPVKPLAAHRLFIIPPEIGATPCLKLQYMFDAVSAWGEDWVEFLKLSILGRRQDIHVLDFWPCEVSRDEGVIHIKCASKEDAGRLKRFLEVCFFGRKYEITYTDVAKYQRMFPIPGSWY